MSETPTVPYYEVAGWESLGAGTRQHAATVTWTSPNGRLESLRSACPDGMITAAIRNAAGEGVPFHPRLPWACKRCVRLLETGQIRVPPRLSGGPDERVAEVTA